MIVVLGGKILCMGYQKNNFISEVKIIIRASMPSSMALMKIELSMQALEEDMKK